MTEKEHFPCGQFVYWDRYWLYNTAIRRKVRGGTGSLRQRPTRTATESNQYYQHPPHTTSRCRPHVTHSTHVRIASDDSRLIFPVSIANNAPGREYVPGHWFSAPRSPVVQNEN